jgi:YcaO-like protein with predicted kinase domain
LWCEGRDLFNGETVLVPYEMVHTNYTMPFPDGHGCFTPSSNGLASGNDMIEAISHGICEVVERDATALWKLRDEEKLEKNRLDLASVDDAICQDVLGKLERAGLTVAAWDITSDIKIAAFACLVVPKEDNAMWHVAVAAGYGCHPAREIALLRALTEAAQVRLTIIAGLRDDFGIDAYEQMLNPDLVKTVRCRISASEPTRCFRDVPTWSYETFEEDVECELKCVEKTGIRRVVIVDLTKAEFGLRVVRVIVPDLEPMPEPGYVPGRRGRAVLRKRA